MAALPLLRKPANLPRLFESCVSRGHADAMFGPVWSGEVTVPF